MNWGHWQRHRAEAERKVEDGARVRGDAEWDKEVELPGGGGAGGGRCHVVKREL